MRPILRVLLCVIGTVGLSCRQIPESGRSDVLNEQEAKAAAVATQYVERRWPHSTMGPDGKKMAPIVVDRGTNWHVYYKLPEGWLGGTPEVTVRKSDLKVVAVHQSQ